MSCSDEKKRKRETNFSQNEKKLLISIISKYAHIVEDKKTDRTSMEMKNKVWKKIESEFNSVCSEGVFRSTDKLKKFFNNKKHDMRIMQSEEAKERYLKGSMNPEDQEKNVTNIIELYENEKKKVKKDVADEKKHLTQTGLGRLPIQKKDGTEELMLSIMNQKTLYGLDIHQFDSDNQNDNIDVNINNEHVSVEYIFEPNTDSDNENTTVPVENLPSRPSTHDREEDGDSLEDTTKGSSTWNVQGFSASQLTKPVSEELKLLPKGKEIIEVTNISTPITSKSCKTNIVGFSRQTKKPTGPKKSNSARRRPTDQIKVLTSSKFAEKYDALLDRRLILVNRQIEDLEEEQVFKRKKRKFELQILQAQLDAVNKE